MFSLFPNTLRLLLASFLWNKEPQALDGATQVRFQLRHQLASSNGSRLVFSNVAPSFAAETYAVNTRTMEIYRPSSYAHFSRARLRSMRNMQSEWHLWDGVETLGPQVRSRTTLLELAKMTYNSYYESGHQAWYDLGWNAV